MNNISIISVSTPVPGSAQAIIGEKITVGVNWSNDVNGTVLVALYEPNNYTNTVSYSWGKMSGPGNRTEYIDINIKPGNVLGFNQLWAYVFDSDGNALAVYPDLANIIWLNIVEYVPPPGIPPVPTLVSPADNSRTDNSQPTFVWNDVSTPRTFRFQLRRLGHTETLIDVTLQQTALSPSIPLTNDSYSWRVRAENSYGNSAWSSEWVIDIGAPGLPAPNLISPADKAQLSTHYPVFSWSSVAGAYRYNIQIQDTPNFNHDYIYTFEYNPQHTPISGIPDGTYYWRVGTQSGGTLNLGAWSAVRTFTISTATPSYGAPDKPVLVSPLNDAVITTTPIFKWNPVSGATSYRLEVATDLHYSTKYIAVDIVGTSYTPPAEITIPIGKYCWNVRAKNNYGNSVWSDSWWFVLKNPTIPPAPAPTPGEKPLGISNTIIYVALGAAALALLARGKK